MGVKIKGHRNFIVVEGIAQKRATETERLTPSTLIRVDVDTLQRQSMVMKIMLEVTVTLNSLKDYVKTCSFRFDKKT